MSSSDGATITKQCVICGADCDGQPRVKDARGRYYHRQCHAEAAERAARGRSGGDGASREATPDAPLIDVMSTSADGAGADWLDTLPQTQPCGGCGRPLPAGAALCTSCGHQAGGGTLSTKKLKAARAPRGGGISSESLKEWLPFLVVPTVVGLATAVIAFGGGMEPAGIGMILMWGLSLIAGIWTLVAAWQRSALICLGVLLGNVFLLGIPGLVFVFFYQDDRRLKGMTGGVILGFLFAAFAMGWMAAAGGQDLDETLWMP